MCKGLNMDVCKLILVMSFFGVTALAADNEVVATVNGVPIHAEQVRLRSRLRELNGLPPDDSQQALDHTIECELIRQFLQKRGIEADPLLLEHRLTLVHQIVKQSEAGSDLLTQWGLDEDRLKKLLSLEIAWMQFGRQVLTEEDYRTEWDSNREAYDGTRVRAAQIVRVLNGSAEPDWEEAERLLTGVREDIQQGRKTFADAAKEFSQSPSAKNGGDLGEFEYWGRIDPSISRVAFSLQPGEVSAPFRTRFGVHIVRTEERIPGQLSLEDAKPEIFEHLSQRMWQDQVQSLRKTAEIKKSQ